VTYIAQYEGCPVDEKVKIFMLMNLVFIVLGLVFMTNQMNRKIEGFLLLLSGVGNIFMKYWTEA